MKTSIDIEWLRVHATPLKKELNVTVTQWINTYTGFSLRKTTRQISNIEKFIRDVNVGIKHIPTGSATQKDKENLLNVITHLKDVKMIKDCTMAELNQ
jgi:aspartate ammonia-lyase